MATCYTAPMFKRGLTFWNVLAIAVGLTVAYFYPDAFPKKHDYGTSASQTR